MIFPEAMRRGLARGLAGAAVARVVAGTPQARGETSVWSMKGEHNTVYLAGSVHALPKEHARTSAAARARLRTPPKPS